MRFNFLAVLLVAALLVSSCVGGGGRNYWETPPGAGQLPLVDYAYTGQIDLTTDANNVGGFYTGTDSIGVDDPSGAAVILPNNTYVTTNGMAPTWVNLGVGPLDVTPANSAVFGFQKIGGAQIFAETSLGVFGTSFSHNLTIKLPLYQAFTAGYAVTVFQWNGNSWSPWLGASQAGNEMVDLGGTTVTILNNRGGQFMVGIVYHDQGAGGTT